MKDKSSCRGNLRYVLWRLDAKAVAMLLALILGIAGICMIYSGIQDQGYIDVKSALVEGKLKSGFVGVIVLFMSMILAIACVVARAMAKPERLELKRGQCSITWQGDTVNFDHDLVKALVDALNEANKMDIVTQPAG